jgi:hypothetical protein
VSRTVVLSPTGIVGYGFPERSFEAGLEAGPQVIGCDGGSTDQGPLTSAVAPCTCHGTPATGILSS